MFKPKIYCNNCGKQGHYYNNCKEPITSYGVICINTNVNLQDLNITPQNGIHTSDMYNFYLLKNDVKFLMVQRRYTLGYIEFIRGRYHVDNLDGIGSLFEQMIQKEIDKISVNSYDELWYEFWGPKEKNKEYYNAKGKFDTLNSGMTTGFPLKFYTENIKPKYTSLEWGFPKGRKGFNEDTLKCALREFNEETGISKDLVNILNIPPFVEKFIGTNGMTYSHVYYIGLLNETDTDVKPLDNSEISHIGWFSYDEAINKIRPYYNLRKSILTGLFINIINMLLE